MQETQEIQELQQTPAVTAENGWRSPEYEIVETALEVTAYLLATR
ncbi:pyrroloquinoline quinone precursor peptide PqqA [Streptomyces sp. GESEQ-35]|nr:pyrroloquinoline quinone precursor peptide PqqA [Streptomyces sp. GESEQ-35]